MDDLGILNRINTTEADVWGVYAQHHTVDGNCLVYDIHSPSSFFSNSIYTATVADRFDLVQAQMLETYYQVHGLEGFLRDFHGDFKHKTMATYTYLYFDPRSSTALASPTALTMHRCAPEELGAFSEFARLSYNSGPEFKPAFIHRVGRITKHWPATFLKFSIAGKPAGVISLVHAGGLSRILHFAVRPDLRRLGYGTEMLQAAVRESTLPVFSATEVPQLAERMFPSAGFRAIAQFQAIPLLSLLR